MEKKFKVPVRVTFTVVVDADVDVFANSEKEAKEIIDGYVSSRYYSDIMSKIHDKDSYFNQCSNIAESMLEAGDYVGSIIVTGDPEEDEDH